MSALNRWFLLAEFFSLLVLGIIFVRYYCYDWRVASNSRRKLFLYCLLSSCASIVLNILCVFTLSRPNVVPLWCNALLNTLYFLLSAVMCTLFAYFLMRLILGHVYDQRPLRLARRLLMTVAMLFVILVALNPLTGLLFYFDENGYYQRGPMNQIGYIFLFLDLLILGVCYFQSRSSVSTQMRYVMRSLPPLVLVLTLLQLAYPEILLNGALSAVTVLILFIAFQSHTSDRDSLTGVRSHNNFLTELSLRLASQQPIHIIMVSLLSLSEINLRHGHSVGDAVLYEAARYLDQFSPCGRAFRPGDATFSLVLPWTSAQQADRDLETVRARFQAPWVLGSLSCRSDFCMTDLHCGNAPNTTAEQVMEWLEYAMSLAKAEHGTVRFDEQIAARLQRKQDLIALMRHAIKEKHFQVWYQPIYCCQEDRCRSAEALLRLTDQENTLILPSAFISLAEETGMIEDLTWMALEEVCRLLSSERVPGLEAVSVNLSMQQLLDKDLTHHLLELLGSYGVTPNQLRLEITERFLLHDAQYARQQLDALRAGGFQIHMDDFGCLLYTSPSPRDTR